MGAFEVANTESNYLNYSTGLLVSILLRYPEIVTISCNYEQQTMVLKFLATTGFDFTAIKTKLYQALEMFHKIEGRQMKRCDMEIFEQEMDLIVISRDLSSITQSEISLIVEMMKDELANKLIADDANLPDEEILLQDEVISHMITAIRANGTEKSLTALREEGRVLVFNG
ncbi:hypothetical protein LPY66_07630 [Dehalobacter sp. DCM]|uniref:hypothetical protein n=1 Tax=Dehalobacter sp. DCM TaxID=2907827 RepID=UPI0030821159|nr:hypothetical protein LPY66_07630 [Dehalobacter sp. DCM]